MPRNECFLPRNNGNRSESIPRNFFGTKFRSQPYPQPPIWAELTTCPLPHIQKFENKSLRILLISLFRLYWSPFLLHQSRSKYCRLKVPSGQIGSTWEWYHWIGLKKNFNRYMFLIFYFWSWIFEKTSKFWAASCKNESNPTSCHY